LCRLMLAAPRFENCRVECGAAQREAVEGDVEEGDVVLLGPLKRPRPALGNGAADGKTFVVLPFSFRLPRLPLRLRQEHVAILEALKRIEQRVDWLALGLHLLSLAEARLRIVPAARLV